MTTSYKSPQSPQEPERSLSEIQLSNTVQPTVGLSAEQHMGDEPSSAIHPALATRPTPPKTPRNHGQLRLKSFASNGVDNLPTVPLPTNVRRIPHEPEIENGHIILYRKQNFYVSTTNRRGQRPNPLRRRSGHTALIPKVAPEQEKRIASSETRLMPKVESIDSLKKSTFPFPVWLEALVVILGLLASFVAHAINLFYFPHYELDEGTYMASAWAILHGMIEPYPYGYGHPPMGWIQIASWVQLTGGFFTFGNALNTGRVLMLFYTLASSLLVYLIVRRLEASRSAALLALIIFSFSPLSIVYQRQIFLDNIGTFWLLLSLYFVVISKSRLRHIVLAALSFGLAILSKEIFVIFIPVIIYAVWLHTSVFQRKFALVAFTYTIIAIGSAFVLMAVLKGELVPPGILPWDHHPHLSMFSTYLSQAQRGQSEGSFSVSWKAWMDSDALLIILSLGTTIFNIVAGWWNRRRLLLALFAITFWILLARGGVIFPFYFIPMIPLVAFNAATTLHTVMKWIGKLTRFDWVRVILLLAVMGVIVSYDMRLAAPYFTQYPAQAQTDALLWMRNHIPHNSVVVINSYFYTDLHEPGGEGIGNGATYPYAHIYWNVAYDPEIRDRLLNNDWKRIDYIVSDPAMLYDIKTHSAQMSILDQALNNSVLQAEFQAQDRDHIDIQIYQVLHKQTPSVIGLAPTRGTTTAVFNSCSGTPCGYQDFNEYIDIYNDRRTI